MIVWIIAAVAVLFIVLVIDTGYVKASPDTAYIISGLRKTPKVLIGKAGVKIPFFEKKDELSLQLIPIDVKTSSAVPTADYLNIKVAAAVNVKLSDTPDLLNLAAQNFLNRKVDYIASVAREVLEGNMREIVGKMELQEMVSDRQKFANLVKENAEPDLAAMGLDIVSFNVQNFVDDSAVIENLGVDNIVKIQKNAAISRAVSEKEIAKARAIAQKEANDAEVAAAQVNAEKKTELAIRQAALQKAYDQINRAGNTVETLMTTRTRAIERRLRSVTAMGDEDELARILGEGAAPLQVDVLDEGPLPLPADAFGIGEAGGADGAAPDDARGHHAGAEGTASVGTASGARGGDAEVDGADRNGAADDLNGEDA